MNVTEGITLMMPTNMEIRRQQSCTQFGLPTDALIQDVKAAFSTDQSVLH